MTTFIAIFHIDISEKSSDNVLAGGELYMIKRPEIEWLERVVFQQSSFKSFGKNIFENIIWYLNIVIYKLLICQWHIG